MIRVLHIVPSIDNLSAGPSHTVPALCSSLKKHGCKVTLCTLGKTNSVTFQSGVEIRTFKRAVGLFSQVYNKLGVSSEMKSFILKSAKNFDIIHTHMLWMEPGFYGYLASRASSIPLVISPRGAMSKWALNHNKFRKYIYMFCRQRKALIHANMFHVTATSEKDEVINYGLGSKKFAIIPNGVDIPTLTIEPEGKKNTVTFLSRIHKKKGVEILIKSWQKISVNFPNWTLEIIGPLDSDYSKKLEIYVQRNDIRNLYFIGEVVGKEKDRKLQESSIFVLPTYSENFGMVVAEALSNGTAVICTKGAPWERLDALEAGWWVDFGVDEISDALVHAMNLSKYQLTKIGGNGRSWMRSDFSWDSIALSMIEHYDYLIKNNNN